MIVTAGGRQVGKSKTLTDKLYKALEEGKKCLYVDVTGGRASIAFTNFKQNYFNKKNPCLVNKVDRFVLLGKGSIRFVDYGYTENPSFRRSDYDFVVIEEIQSLVEDLKPDYVTVTPDEYLGGVGDYLISKLNWGTVKEFLHDTIIKRIDETEDRFYIEDLDGKIFRIDK